MPISVIAAPAWRYELAETNRRSGVCSALHFRDMNFSCDVESCIFLRVGEDAANIVSRSLLFPDLAERSIVQ
jgi:hypothetical protein